MTSTPEEQRTGDAQFSALLEQVGRASPIPLSALQTERFFLPGEPLMNGRFTVGARLGEGGMGVVYEAFDAEREARVALKLLSRVDALSILRFKQEFRSLAEVVHPHLSRMHALFCWRGSWFFSMDLLHGTNFLTHYQRLEAPSKRLDFLRSALSQLEAGLSALHRMDKLHCDLKPSNVFVSPAGHVTIVDFGLIVDPRAGVASHTLGTPGYVAGELLRGDAPSVASDWYAVGVMLHQALTGALPAPHQPTLLPTSEPADLSAICCALLHEDPRVRAHGVSLIRQRNERAELVLPLPPLAPQLGCVGRRAELTVLRAALTEARRGKRVLCRVSGASGAGKSTLVRAFLASLDASDTLVLSGRCFERELTPFKLLDGVVDALADELTQAPRPLSDVTLRAADALARAFPSMGKLDARSARPERAPAARPEQQRRQLGDALCHVLQAASGGRTAVLAIDDSQWSDADGAALCAALLERVSPLLLILVQRDEPSTHLDPLMRAVRAAGGLVSDLTVGSLLAEDMRALVQQLSKSVHVSVEEVVREAQGSPYLAIELMQYAHARSSQPVRFTLEEALRARLALLPPAALTVLQLVAVSGAPLEARVLRSACAGHDADRAVALLQAHCLLRSHGDEPARIDVYHDRVRSTLFSLLAHQPRRALHSRLADAFESTRPDEVESLALHLQAAGQLTRAASYAWQAGRRAVLALAFEQATAFLTQAQGEGAWNVVESAQLARELGDALSVLGRAAEAGAQYLRSSQQTAGPGRHKLALLSAGQLLCGGQLQQGFDILRANLGGRHGPLPAVEQLGHAFPILLAELLRWLAAPISASPPTVDTEAALQVDACYWAALGLAGSDTDGIGSYLLLRQAVEALELGDPLRIVRALELTAALGSCVQSPLMLSWCALMVERATRVAAPLADPRVPFWRAFRLACQAHWAFDRVATHDHLAAADRYARACHGVQRERLLLWFFCGFRDFEAGRVAEHFARAQQVHDDALRHRDLHAEVWSDLTNLRPLFLDQPEQRLRLLATLPTRYGDALTGFPSYVLDWQLAVAERAAGQLATAHARMKRLLREARDDAVFWSIPLNRAAILSETIAATLAYGATCEDVQPWLSEVETLLSEHPAPSSWLLPSRAAVAALRCDLSTTCRLLQESALHGEVANGFWITRCARLLLAALQDDHEAMARATRELLDAGVTNPRKLAEVVIPAIRVSSLADG